MWIAILWDSYAPMLEDLASLPVLLMIFLGILALNIIPVFAPPTWIALSVIGLSNPSVNGFVLAFIGATAATLGRVVLAKLSRVIVRAKLLSADARENVDAIRQAIERRPILSFGAIAFYAFGPLPSNYLFIAYGLTTLRLTLAAIPFFFGRLVSYSFWILTTAAVGRKLDIDPEHGSSYAGVYFIATQLLLFPAIYLFVKLDWKRLLTDKTLRWRRRPDPLS